MIYLINQFYGQGEHLKSDLCLFLIKKGYNLKIITGDNGDRALPRYERFKNEEIARIATPRMTRTVWGRVKSYVAFLWGALWHIAAIEEGSTVVVTTQPFFTAFMVAIFKKNKKLRIIYNVQDLNPDVLYALGKVRNDSLFGKVVHFIQAFTMKKSDIIVAIGFSMEKKIIENYKILPEKIMVIENWGKKEMENMAMQYAPKRAVLRVLYTGNMGESHEVDTLWDTFQMLREKGVSQGVEFKIIGMGRNYEKIKKLCFLHQIDFVKFAEPVPDNKLYLEYERADISIVISHKTLEGVLVPSKFYTAAAVCPVIYLGSMTDDPSAHIKRGKFGYVIENGDAKSLFFFIFNLKSDIKSLELLRKNSFFYYNNFLHSSFRLQEWESAVSQFEKKTISPEIQGGFQ